MATTSRRWWAWAALALGLVLIVTAVLAWPSATPAPTDAGVLPAIAVRSPTASVPTGPTTTSAASGVGHSPTTSARSRTPVPAAVAPRTSRPAAAVSSAPRPSTSNPSAANATVAAPPAQIELPALGVQASVDPVHSVDGELQVPEDPQRVGWWAGSSPAGVRTGSTVLDGHIDSATLGIGAFFHLSRLGPGDPVVIRTTRGDTIHYTVVARRVYVKAQGLPADIFTDPGYARLVLISCGGPFDESARSYDDNVVVFATPS